MFYLPHLMHLTTMLTMPFILVPQTLKFLKPQAGHSFGMSTVTLVVFDVYSGVSCIETILWGDVSITSFRAMVDPEKHDVIYIYMMDSGYIFSVENSMVASDRNCKSPSLFVS
jgi:hypothetical protein